MTLQGVVIECSGYLLFLLALRFEFPVYDISPLVCKYEIQ